MTQLLVDVRPEHIAIGDCKSPQRCMIAVAIKENDVTASYVSVRTNCITVTHRRRDGASVRQHWAVPMKAAKAIVKFDNGEPIRPFSFKSTLIDERILAPIDPKQAKKNLQQTKKRRAKREAAGIPEPKYGRRARVAGV